jgi:ABC-type multidrug transport system ATPase subunit
VLSHGAGVYNHLTARENITYFGELHWHVARGSRGACRGTARAARDAAVRGPARQGLFAGQKLKTALARALVHRPKNVLLDEPTNGLDVMAVRGLRKLLSQLREAGHCVLFSSHVMQEVEQLCDEVVVIANGQVVAAGTLADIRARGGDRLEDAFVALMEPAEPSPGPRHEPARHLGGVSARSSAKTCATAARCCRPSCSVRFSGHVLVAGVVQFSYFARRGTVRRRHPRGRDASGARTQPAGLSQRARRGYP